MEDLKNAKIPAAIIRNVAEVMEDRHARDLMMSDGGFKGIRSYVGQSGSISPHLSPPPHLGQHTREVLENVLKISPTAVMELKDQGIIR